MQIKDLPQMSPLRVVANGKTVNATFHRTDGSFSKCTIDDDLQVGVAQRIFHLHVLEHLHEVDGRWELVGSITNKEEIKHG